MTKKGKLIQLNDTWLNLKIGAGKHGNSSKKNRSFDRHESSEAVTHQFVQ